MKLISTKCFFRAIHIMLLLALLIVLLLAILLLKPLLVLLSAGTFTFLTSWYNNKDFDGIASVD
ncbi:hypothetical protein [Pedobacter panaciterrae]|uniref:hypothetical protein n=1 Tax=Pedobacter panaciterrae TaxID=363849 RepID=UPI00155DAF3C|nr:hypothetical protein [Pedobacter panaciterrae]